MKDLQDPLLFLLIELTHRERGLVLLSLHSLHVDLELLIIHGHLNVISINQYEFGELLLALIC